MWLLSVCLLAVVLTGCGKSAKNRLVGRWQGRIEFDDAKVDQKLQESANSPIQRAIAEKMIKGFESSTFDIELKKDGSFTSTLKIGPMTTNGYGKWEVVNQKGNRATIRLTDQDGKVQTPTITFSDNDTFTTDATGPVSEIAVFRCKRVQQ
jgi:hypothetical protein